MGVLEMVARAAKINVGLEKDVKQALREFLKSLGPKCYSHWPVPVGYGESSLDCIGCYDGFFFAIECKRETGGDITDRQQATMKKMWVSGGLTWIEDSCDLYETKASFRYLDKKSSWMKQMML